MRLRPTRPRASGDSRTGELPPLVLTQIHFVKGMRGRFGSTRERDQTEPQWYEFFGDIQLARAKVSSPRSILNFDKLPADGMFLTSQTLRVRTEPPPAGSPPSTPARDYVKAWENAYVYSSDKVLQADVITYDSEKDLIYAFGENGRGVNLRTTGRHRPADHPGSGQGRAVQPQDREAHCHRELYHPVNRQELGYQTPGCHSRRSRLQEEETAQEGLPDYEQQR